MTGPRKLLEWQGLVLPAGWEGSQNIRKWYRYQVRHNGELLRLLTGQDRNGGWRWKVEVRAPEDREWRPFIENAGLLGLARFARKATDYAVQQQDKPELQTAHYK